MPGLSNLDSVIADGIRAASTAVRSEHPHLNLDDAAAQAVAASALSAIHQELTDWASRDARRRVEMWESDGVPEAALHRFATADVNAAVHATRLSAATDAAEWIRGSQLIVSGSQGFVADNINQYILASGRDRDSA